MCIMLHVVCVARQGRGDDRNSAPLSHFQNLSRADALEDLPALLHTVESFNNLGIQVPPSPPHTQTHKHPYIMININM